MNWGLLGQLTVIWIIVAVLAAPFVGRWLRKRREQKGRTARTTSLAQLVTLADEYHSAPTASERQSIYRKAQSLGFTEEDEQNREWEGAASSLDEDVQPHSDPPRAA